MKKNRKDAKLIKQDNGIFNLIYYLKPKRAYAEVYINKKFDVTNLVKYMEKLKKKIVVILIFIYLVLLLAS